MDKNILKKLNEEFASFELELKNYLAKLVKEEPTKTILPCISRFAQSQATSVIESTNLVSIALLVDDIFDISFSPDLKIQNEWSEISYLETGSIGRHCRKTVADKKKRWHVVEKSAMAAEKLTQKPLFLSSKEMELIYYAPIVVGEHIVGSVQLSLSENKLADRKLSEGFLIWLTDKIGLVLLSEQARLSSALDTAKIISRTLDVKDEYQSNHSRNVAKMASYFIRVIVSNPGHFMPRLFPDGGKISGISTAWFNHAALLHDTGKLVMSNESFEGVTNLADYCKRQMHPFYTDMVLSGGKATKGIALLASMHHEKPNGSGYPFGAKQDEDYGLTVASQIISFADAIDSWFRERPRKKLIVRTHASITDYVSQPRVKSKFADHVYEVLKEILGLAPSRDDLSDDLKKLFGLTKKLGAITLEANTELEDLLKQHHKKLSDYGLANKWVVFIAVRGKTDGLHHSRNAHRLRPIKYPELVHDRKGKAVNLEHGSVDSDEWDNKVFLANAKDDSELIFGVHITKLGENRDDAYALCASIHDSIQKEKCRMAAAFVNAKFLGDRVKMSGLRDSLMKTTKKMSPEDRWKLLSPSQIGL